MSVVISLFLFALAIGYVEYRLKGVKRDTDNEQSGAMDYFATKEEVKRLAKQWAEQAEADRLAFEERMASIEQKAFFDAEIKKKAAEEKAAQPVVEADPSVVFFAGLPTMAHSTTLSANRCKQNIRIIASTWMTHARKLTSPLSP